MKITKVEQQKKNTNRYSIYVDEEFLIGVDEEVLIKYNLFKGQELSEQEINKVKSAEQNQKIYIRAINYLSYGLRSIAEMRQYLVKHKEDFAVDGSVFYMIDATIERLTQEGYLNDQLYAESYVRTAATINFKGPKVIERELRANGVDQYVVMDALEEYPETQRKENIEKLADKYIRTKKNLSSKMLERRLYTHLIQKGFPTEQVNEHLKEIVFSDLIENEWDLLDKEAHKQLRKHQRKHNGYQLKQRISQSLFTKGFDFELINQWLDNQAEVFEE